MVSTAGTRATGGGTVRILNCLPSPDQEDDWTFASAEEAGVAAPRARLPASVDLRAAWWAVGDQGRTGSCVGWAVADSLLRWHFVTAGRLAQARLLSVRFAWMAAKETDPLTRRPTTFIEPEGTTLKAALDVARRFGAVLDDDLPFGRPRLFAGDAKAFYLKAAQRKIASYVNLGRDVRAWKQWLAGHGPVLTRLDCDDAWMDLGPTGKLTAYDRPTIPRGHAVALVGYTADHLVVRNSWGTTRWGDQGFAYASYRYAEDAFTEAYGVTVT